MICTYLLIRHTFIIDQSQRRACTAETAGNSTRQVSNLETSEEQLLTSHNRPVRQVWMYQICGSAKCINDNDLIEEGYRLIRNYLGPVLGHDNAK